MRTEKTVVSKPVVPESFFAAILGYPAWVYWVFCGKVDTKSGYHH